MRAGSRAGAGPLGLLLLSLLTPAGAPAGLPLLGDDSGTLGGGRWQLEWAQETAYESEGPGGFSSSAFTLTAGLGEELDAALSLPYAVRWQGAAEAGRAHGAGDLGISLKRRLAQRGPLGAALKAGLSLPTAQQGLGAEGASADLLLVAGLAAGDWGLHFNAGWNRDSGPDRGLRRDLLRAGALGSAPLFGRLRLGLEVQLSQAPDPADGGVEARYTGGLIADLGSGAELCLGLRRLDCLWTGRPDSILGLTLRR